MKWFQPLSLFGVGVAHCGRLFLTIGCNAGLFVDLRHARTEGGTLARFIHPPSDCFHASCQFADHP